MKTTPLMLCDNDLDFKPRQAWPNSLPVMVFNKSKLCGFSRAKGEAILVETSALVDTVFHLYPQLGLSELARIYTLWKKSEAFQDLDEWSWSDFFSRYNLRYCERLTQNLQALSQLPEEFQNWVDQKKLGPRDLRVLLGLNEWTKHPDLFIHLAHLNPQKSLGTETLELFVELLEMNHSPASLLEKTTSAQEWRSHLYSLRNPRETQTIKGAQEIIRHWPWPNTVSAQWSRQGDEAGIEIKFLARSKNDFIKKLNGLQNAAHSWTDNIK